MVNTLKGGGDSIGAHAKQTKEKIGKAQKGPLNHAFGNWQTISKFKTIKA